MNIYEVRDLLQNFKLYPPESKELQDAIVALEKKLATFLTQATIKESNQ